VSSPGAALDLARENARLELASPEERLAFAAETFGDDVLVEKLGLRLRVLHPDIPRAKFDADYGSDIQKKDPDFCCGVNKVAPISALKESARGWVSGLRRDQSRTRADVAILETDEHLVRVHPIATLTAADVAAYLARHGISEHPLVARRYLSIGCSPCTRAVAEGEDERAGRWDGSAKTECGLHARGSRQGLAR
jgi:phosphoadenosine phosphosulfate reductase